MHVLVDKLLELSRAGAAGLHHEVRVGGGARFVIRLPPPEATSA